MDSTTHIDKLIVSLCEYTRRIINSDKILNDSKNIAESTKALAELVSARVLMGRD